MISSSSSSSSSSLSYHSPLLPCPSTRKSRIRGGVYASYSNSGYIQVKDVSYRPPGTDTDILKGVNLALPEKSLGLIYGRSGSGKTTLLQILAGLCKPTTGSVCTWRMKNCDGKQTQVCTELSPTKVGIVFQFPERYFLTCKIIDELLFGWPRHNKVLSEEILAMRLQAAIHSVGLTGMSLEGDPQSLSGGFKRRLALAVQLVRMPDLLLLDEPLAGLDWKSRADIVKLLRNLKKEQTLLIVSHDLREIAELVDKSWTMEMGGILKEAPLTKTAS